MIVRPGSNYVFSVGTQDTTGAAVEADSVTASLRRNGVVDGAVTVNVAKSTGVATFAFGVPADYENDDYIELVASATVGGIVGPSQPVLRANVETAASGSGPNAVTVIALDADDNPIEGVSITAKQNGILQGDPVLTDSDGEAIKHLFGGSNTIYGSHRDYAIASKAITVTGDQSTTLEMTARSLPTPADPGKVNVLFAGTELGLNLPDSTVWMAPVNGAFQLEDGSWVPTETERFTMENGQVEIPNVLPSNTPGIKEGSVLGNYTITAEGYGLSGSVTITVNVGDTPDEDGYVRPRRV